MAFGQFGLPPADILVGPGNAYVAEAKRQLFGRVGIDMVAGPTDSMIIADAGADADLVAADLVGQAEHGPTSPVWLVTDSADLANAVMARVPVCIASLPEPNRTAAATAWSGRGEVVLCDTREEMAAHADRIAPEHLHVQAADLGWWRGRLRAYGSLFLGAATTVAFGDEAAGTNHVLVGAGNAPCVILMIGYRPDREELCYPVSAAAAKYGASVAEETPNQREAYGERDIEPTAPMWPLWEH